MLRQRPHLCTCTLLAIVLGCSEAPPTASSAPLPAAPAPTAPAKPASASAGGPAAPLPDAIPEAEVRALVERWVALQNGGDFAGYSALYDARFHGVRRSGPRVRSFDRAGWLRDRERMFKKPMRVAVERVNVAASEKMAVVTFDQDWSSESYHDRGPKRMVVTRGANGLAIASEELLASEEVAEGATRARLVLSTSDGASYVLVAKTDQAAEGEPLAVDVGYPTVAVFAAPNGSDAAAPFLAGPVTLVGGDGTCTARGLGARIVHVATVHFGTVQAWRGEGGDPAASSGQVARDLREIAPQAWLAVELERGCEKGKVAALPGAATPTVFAHHDAEPALAARAKRAFASLPIVAKLPRTERRALADAATVQTFGEGDAVWVVVSGVTGCDVGVQGLGVFRLQGFKLAPMLDSEQTDLLGIEAVVDLDGDGTPELVGSGAFGTPRRVITVGGRPLTTVDAPYFDCPC